MIERPLLALAGVIALAHLVLHLAGGREATGILSGTGPLEGAAVLLGVAYAGSSLLLVVVAPVLVLATLLRAGLDRIWPERAAAAQQAAPAGPPTGSGSSPAGA